MALVDGIVHGLEDVPVKASFCGPKKQLLAMTLHFGVFGLSAAIVLDVPADDKRRRAGKVHIDSEAD